MINNNYINRFLNPSNKLFFLYLISIQAIVFYIIQNKSMFTSPDLSLGDSYSFYHYNFQSLESFLSQYRSFGGPIIIYLYKFFDNDLLYWSYFNFLIFNFSLLFLFYSLMVCNFDKLFSFFFVIGILGSHKLWYLFGHWSEILSITTVIFSLSFYLLIFNKGKLRYYFFFIIFVFFSYQIRPLLFMIIFFFILLDILLRKFFLKEKFPNKKNFKIILSTILPLIIFVIFRLIITGHVGIAPYSGVHLGAHGLFYLSEKNINELNFDKKFLKNLLIRKQNHDYPCSLDYIEIKNFKKDIYFKCYTENTMSLILETSKYLKNKEPFEENDIRNFNSWKYVKTLDKFFMTIDNHNEIDNFSREFAYVIIGNNLSSYLKEFRINLKKAYKNQFIMNNKLVILYLVSLIIMPIYVYFNRQNKDVFLEFDKKIPCLLISIILTNFFTIIILCLIHLPKIRVLTVQGVFFIPIIFSYSLYLLQKFLIRFRNNQK